MVTTYIYPSNAQVGKSQALVSGSAGLFLPNINEPVYYMYAGVGPNLVQVPINLPVAPNSIVSSVNSAAYDSNTSIIWLTSNNSNILGSQNDLPGTLYVTSGTAYLNGSTLIGDQPYFSSFNNELYTVSGGIVSGYAAVASGTVGLGYSASGTTLFTALPAVNSMLAYNTVSKSSTISAAPVSHITQIKAFAVNSVSGAAAVAGTCQGPLRGLASTNVALAPDGAFCAFVNPSNNTINLLEGPDPNWSLINTLGATGAANWCAWNDTSTQVLTTNTGNSTISVYAVANSALSLTQTLTVPNSGNTRITEIPGSGQMVYCNSANNYVEFLSFSGSWATSQQVVIASPQAIAVISPTEIVIAGANAISYVSYVNDMWGITGSASLVFTPVDITIDTNGTVYAVGHSGGFGYLTAVYNGIIGYYTWDGSGNSVIWEQGQIFVSDETNSVIKSFSFIQGMNTGYPYLFTQQDQDLATHQYIMGESTGTVATDTGSSPSNGTYVGSIIYQASSFIAGLARSIYIEANSYVQLPFADFTGINGAFSLEIPLSQIGGIGTGIGVLFANGDVQNSNSGILVINGNDTVPIHIMIGTAGGFTSMAVDLTSISGYPGYSPLPILLAFSFDGTILSAYGNGKLLNSLSVSGAYIPSVVNGRIATPLSGQTDYGEGGDATYQCVAFYNYAMSTEKFYSHYLGLLGASASISLFFQNDIFVKTAPNHLDSGGITIFGSTGTDIFQYSATSPFNMSLIPYGWVSTVNIAGAWGPVCYLSPAFERPEAVVWNPNNGHINVGTTLNNLYEISGSSIISQTSLADYTGVHTNVPMGISDLKWFVDGHLYASTSMNDALLRIS